MHTAARDGHARFGQTGGMELQDAVRTRRMVRSYDPDRPVEREQVQKLMNLAIRAPSAGHTQGWRFLVLDDITSRDRFWSATASGPADAWLARMQSAPVLVVCFADRDAYLDRYAEPDKGWADRDPARWPVPYWDVDTGMAALILLLAAHDAGLAGVLLRRAAGPLAGAVRGVRGAGAACDPVGVVSLGYPAPTTCGRRRCGADAGR